MAITVALAQATDTSVAANSEVDVVTWTADGTSYLTGFQATTTKGIKVEYRLYEDADRVCTEFNDEGAIHWANRSQIPTVGKVFDLRAYWVLPADTTLAGGATTLNISATILGGV